MLNRILPTIGVHGTGRRRSAPAVRRSALAVLALTALAPVPTALAAESQASDAEVRRNGDRVDYGSGLGATNSVHVFEDSIGELFVTDTAGVRGAISCLNTSPTSTRCGSGVQEVQLVLVDGNDVATPEAAVATTVVGGDGNNTVNGGRAPDESAVTYRGGRGTDAVVYNGADRFVTITLDGAANDGRPGDADNIAADVENVTGSLFPDRLTGSAVANRIDGGLGPDTVAGLGGDDRLVEGARPSGADTFSGGGAVDTVDYSSRTATVRVDINGVADDGQVGEGDFVRVDVENARTGTGSDVLAGSGAANGLNGGGGVDQVSGMGGNDDLTGGPGVDTINGNAGDDGIDALDGDKDTVNCGSGEDVAVIDQGVDVVQGCETVRFSNL